MRNSLTKSLFLSTTSSIKEAVVDALAKESASSFSLGVLFFLDLTTFYNEKGPDSHIAIIGR